MKTHILTAISISMLFSAPPSHALEPEQRPQPQKAPDARPDITIRATIVAVPNAEAIQFSAKQDLNGKPPLAPLFSMFSRNYNLNPAFDAGSR